MKSAAQAPTTVVVYAVARLRKPCEGLARSAQSCYILPQFAVGVAAWIRGQRGRGSLSRRRRRGGEPATVRCGTGGTGREGLKGQTSWPLSTRAVLMMVLQVRKLEPCEGSCSQRGATGAL